MNNKLNKIIRVLAVDDEPFNLDIMQEYFSDERIECLTAENGSEALKRLEDGAHVDVIVLDRMMPVMNGMEFLHHVKEAKQFRDIPIIMQTAATASHQVAEGIKSGVFYYLSKPYSKEVLLSLIRAANDDSKQRLEIREHIARYGKAMKMVEQASFKFKTIEDAKALALLISSCLPDAESKSLGLTELMINSVEHGNLNITYEEKVELKHANRWNEEILKRLALNENQNKVCSLHIAYDEAIKEFTIKVKDQGNGFDWERFSKFDTQRLTDPNGRGIMISQNCGFDTVRYLGNGNEFECKVKIKN